MEEQSRLYALARQVPAECTAGALPWPDVIVVLPDSCSTACSLYRWTRDGRFGGDTWHERLEDALRQAAIEYEELLEEWKRIPAEVDDVQGYAIAVAAAALDAEPG